MRHRGASTAKEIRINGANIYFDAESWKRGKLKMLSCGEQCEGCGKPVEETGTINHDCVTCDDCGTVYTATDTTFG